jgi:hypothetical protein
MAAEENMEEVAVEQEEKEEEISSEEDPEVKGPRRPKRPGLYPRRGSRGRKKQRVVTWKKMNIYVPDFLC